jgi:preprotein translocase subunit SecE
VAKKKKEKKKGIGGKITQYFRDVKAEMKKVSWPGRDQVIASTVVVIIVVVFLTLLVGILDVIFVQLVKWLTFNLGG